MLWNATEVARAARCVPRSDARRWSPLLPAVARMAGGKLPSDMRPRYLGRDRLACAEEEEEDRSKRSPGTVAERFGEPEKTDYFNI